ncbi:MAG: hypothetical protein HYU29_02240 [Chloroflexi bacterium]|nr:hypothetical protein [Chloroflexota bacterium]
MGRRGFPARAGYVILAALALSLVVASCGRATPAAKQENLRATILIQTGEMDSRWFRDVEVPRGTNAYELTEKVTKGELKATYYPQFRTHFVDAIFGVSGKSPHFWLIFLWNDVEKRWESLPVGADLFSLKDGHVLAWYYVDTSQPGRVPPVTP